MAADNLFASLSNIALVKQMNSEIDRMRERLQDVARDVDALESSVRKAFTGGAKHVAEFSSATKKS